MESSVIDRFFWKLKLKTWKENIIASEHSYRIDWIKLAVIVSIIFSPNFHLNDKSCHNHKRRKNAYYKIYCIWHNWVGDTWEYTFSNYKIEGCLFNEKYTNRFIVDELTYDDWPENFPYIFPTFVHINYNEKVQKNQKGGNFEKLKKLEEFKKLRRSFKSSRSW